MRLVQQPSASLNFTNADWHRFVVAPLREVLEPERIIIFGSSVWGSPNADSDVDICIVARPSGASPFQQAVVAHKALSSATFAKDILIQTVADFERYSGVEGTLQHRIAREGKIIYERRV